MKKMLIVLAIMALCATSFAATTGQVTVNLTVDHFAELHVIHNALAANGTTPLDFLDGTYHNDSGVVGGEFEVRCNGLSQLSVTLDHVSNSGHYASAYSNVTDHYLNYGLACTLGAVTVGADQDTINGTLHITNIPAGISQGSLKVFTYSDSLLQAAGGRDLAPVGVYTSILTLDISAM